MQVKNLSLKLICALIFSFSATAFAGSEALVRAHGSLCPTNGPCQIDVTPFQSVTVDQNQMPSVTIPIFEESIQITFQVLKNSAGSLVLMVWQASTFTPSSLLGSVTLKDISKLNLISFYFPNFESSLGVKSIAIQISGKPIN